MGGSILTHEHFQGGHYTFAMTKAPIETAYAFAGYKDIEAGIVKWPMSVLRLRGDEPARICDLADKVLQAWRGYTDPDAFIYAETDGTPHNTITPIARFGTVNMNWTWCCATTLPPRHARTVCTTPTRSTTILRKRISA